MFITSYRYCIRNNFRYKYVIIKWIGYKNISVACYYVYITALCRWHRIPSY
ncbi:hypothetical protein Cassandra_0307 [Pseudomonas phage Cassandra]|nr:hypothetical protein Cassandra_0307 [Pseudomonas phage Cassandra]